ncbi:hypothetical protein PCS_02592 [Desulfocurvibacter africanus PCS]|uniref:Uncharacterized protein n=1 Tax=Desulfocurvibacter africanus PCS TaxID=1262666 RepID=M5PR95_DESAF|nr:hypothetical protein [Desulfocurvibacter africanus]EMG36580.1 hypothetical protein PCS_02592 [Desulfocurvibacter africanus PCS]
MPAILIIPPTLQAATIKQSLRVQLRPVIQFGLTTEYHFHEADEMVLSGPDHSEGKLELLVTAKKERKG